MEGTVKWYNRKKGYGFIQAEDGKEYFVHGTALKETRFLRDNDKVSFEGVEAEKGLQAQNVEILQKGSEMAGASESAPADEPESEDFGTEEDSAEEVSEEPAEEESSEESEEEKTEE